MRPLTREEEAKWIHKRPDGKGGYKEHILYAGLLALAHERELVSIKTVLLHAPCADNEYLAIVHATVAGYNEKGNLVSFDGIGDASPKNVGNMVALHATRMAETRAKGRALRDYLNIGVVMREELADSEFTGLQGGDEWDQDDMGAATARPLPPARGAVVGSAPVPSTPPPRQALAPVIPSSPVVPTVAAAERQRAAAAPGPSAPATPDQRAALGRLCAKLGEPYPEETARRWGHATMAAEIAARAKRVNTQLAQQQKGAVALANSDDF